MSSKLLKITIIKIHIQSHQRMNLLTILSVADDLDAFGFIGIYRYSEIYLTRGIDPEKIGTTDKGKC